jgi:chromosomal replication initiator protein
MSKKKDIWQQITKNLQSQIPKSDFSTWFSQTALKEFHPESAVIGVPNKFVANWLADKYLAQIKRSFKSVLKVSPEVHFTHNDIPAAQGLHESRTSPEELHLKYNLNPSMTFTQFFISDCNRFACSSALEVANRPNGQYNPLYIFSECSMGKTHLLNAIGNHVLGKNPLSLVKYLSSDTFTTDLTYSIHNKRLHEFRERYCHLDLLLYDDVQMLANRRRTQEEFLSIFNSLYGAKKQIVITGNNPPHRLKNISSPLKSRLGSGVLTEIALIDQKTKIDFIKKKAEEDDIDLPDDVIFFLAKSNKDMKGLTQHLARIETYASLHKGEMNISLVKCLSRGKGKEETGIEEIKSITASYFNISVSDLISNKKERVYSYPRQLAMYLCIKYTNCSFKEIGDSFGKKDHSTVIYAVRQTENYKDLKKEIRNDLNIIENLIS